MCQFLIGGNAHRLLSLVVDGRQCPRQCLTCRLESASIISDLPDQLVIIAFKRTRLFVVRIQCHFLVVPKAHQFFTQWIIRTVLILVRHQCDLLAQLFIDADIVQGIQRRGIIFVLFVVYIVGIPITLKYTQSNSVCYTYGGQTIGVGAGQQSRIHCTRLAGQKADNWQLRHMDKVLDLPFRDDVAKPNRDNAIDVYIGDTPEDVIGDDVWAETFTEQPAPLTVEEKRAWLDAVTGVSLGSDAFFPFGDNIERARRSGVTAIVQPGGSIRDAQVIDTCNKYGIAMAFCGIRLFHH